MTNARCECRLLAQGLTGYIEFCAHCGVFHVHIDSVSLRFHPAALQNLHATLTAALSGYKYLQQNEQPEAAPQEIH